MKKKLKKLSLNQLQGVEIKKHELKYILGGGGPEANITCGSSGGQCWESSYDNYLETGNYCRLTGYPMHYCIYGK